MAVLMRDMAKLEYVSWDDGKFEHIFLDTEVFIAKTENITQRKLGITWSVKSDESEFNPDAFKLLDRSLILKQWSAGWRIYKISNVKIRGDDIEERRRNCHLSLFGHVAALKL